MSGGVGEKRRVEGGVERGKEEGFVYEGGRGEGDDEDDDEDDDDEDEEEEDEGFDEDDSDDEEPVRGRA